MRNRMTTGRAVISALALWLAFSGVAAAEQLYVNESGWWRNGGGCWGAGMNNSTIDASIYGGEER